MTEIREWLEVLARNKKPLKVLLVPISKSGTTMEITTAFLYFYEYLSRHSRSVRSPWSRGYGQIAGNWPLNRLAGNSAGPCLMCPLESVAGSACCPPPVWWWEPCWGWTCRNCSGAPGTWMKPAGAGDIETNPALFNATLKYVSAASHGATIEVIMPYAMRLKALGEWYVQLLAESLGKRKNREGETVFYGRTPVVAIGTTDMHAQTQMHQEGRRDKVVQFLFVESWKGKLTVHNPFLKSPNTGGMREWMQPMPCRPPWKPMKRP